METDMERREAVGARPNMPDSDTTGNGDLPSGRTPWPGTVPSPIFPAVAGGILSRTTRDHAGHANHAARRGD